MVKVVIDKNKIKITGHSGYDSIGKDIVCSAISSIIQTTIRSIDSVAKGSISYNLSEGNAEINIIKEDKLSDALLLVMIDLLRDLAKDYPKNIKVIGGLRCLS